MLVVTADLADGSLRVRAALYDVGGKRILLFADYTEPCPAKDEEFVDFYQLL